MHPILVRPRHLALYLLVFLPAGWLLAEQLARGASAPRGVALLFAVPLILLHAFSCLASWYLCRSLPLSTARVERLLVAHGVAATLASGVVLLLADAWAKALGGLLESPVPARLLSQGTVPIATSALLIFLLVVAVHYLLIAAEARREAEQRAVELRLLAREAELRALKMQIDPHFLFNSLNTISALVTSRPKDARAMCIHLAGFLRRSLGLAERETVPLAEEVALLREYLDVERVRFGDRLTVQIHLDDGSETCTLPPLLLQPLVENAIRHGIAQQLEGGTLDLRAERRGRRLWVRVRNPCDGDGAPRGEGIGLDNVRRRLQSAHGDGGELRVERLEDLFQVEVWVPQD